MWGYHDTAYFVFAPTYPDQGPALQLQSLKFQWFRMTTVTHRGLLGCAPVASPQPAATGTDSGMIVVWRSCLLSVHTYKDGHK